MGFGFRYTILSLAILLQSFVHAVYAKHFHHNAINLRSKKLRHCDIYEGRWVFDETYPLYDSLKCPYNRKEFDCIKYGRPNSKYLKYRWQPKHCDIPRFNGRDFLERFKGKKIMFIGDSLSLNNWVSLVCLLQAAVPQSNITYQFNYSSISTIKFQDYGVSVMLFRSLYLVDIEQEQIGRVLKLDSIKGGDTWKDMDILISYTWQWWDFRGPEHKKQWDYIKDGDKIYKDMNRTYAFQKGLMTWANWVNSAVDPTKTKVFFQGISPSHYKEVRMFLFFLTSGADWNKPRVKSCEKETKPLKGSTYPSGLPIAATIVNDVLSTITKPVELLNVTTLSEMRKDAHPSKYNGVNKRMDCTHWCLAGLPDTWNQLLYISLIR